MIADHATPDLFAALAIAQGKVENATKGSQNPHFKSRYADLAEILNTVRPVFAAEGLSILQSTGFDGAVVSVSTVLAHKSGGYVSSVASCVPAKTDAQGIGAATTYLRRYSLAAMAGVAQEDDDGNSAAHSGLPAVTPTAGVWERLEPEEQAWLAKVAADVAAMIPADLDAAADHLKAQQLDADEKTAIWTRFDSKQRAALKKAMKEAA